MLNLFIGELDDGSDCTFSKFAADTALRGVARIHQMGASRRS